MNGDEKKQILAVIRAVEYLFFENVALKTVLKTHRVPEWKAQVERLMAHETQESEMRARFRRLYEQVEQSPDESKLIAAFLRVFPKSETSH